MAEDADLQNRVAACAAQEQPTEPRAWMYTYILAVCAAPGWDAAWASALASGNETPGRDPAVITDGQILSSVQAVLAALASPPDQAVAG
jgi:hypothetical protein